jgi:hypothetical protein
VVQGFAFLDELTLRSKSRERVSIGEQDLVMKQGRPLDPSREWAQGCGEGRHRGVKKSIEFHQIGDTIMKRKSPYQFTLHSVAYLSYLVIPQTTQSSRIKVREGPERKV